MQFILLEDRAEGKEREAPRIQTSQSISGMFPLLPTFFCILLRPSLFPSNGEMKLGRTLVSSILTAGIFSL